MCSSEWAGMSIFDVVHPAFPLLTTTLPTLKDALKDGFGEAVVACDMPEPCKFPSLDSCQKRFLWTHKEVDHHHDQSLDREGRWGTTDDFATSLLHFSLFSTALWGLPNSRPVHSLMFCSTPSRWSCAPDRFRKFGFFFSESASRIYVS